MAKTVLITGSSTGIGAVTAKYFQKKGWNVAATMRTPEKAGAWAKGETLICPRLDVTDTPSIQLAIGETLKRFGSIDVLINNAGYAISGPFEAASPEQIERQFNTNVLGLMNVVREILPHFRERNDGVLINIASVGGRATFPLYSLYHGTKWAVEGFSESLQYELQPFNIKVKIIEPGIIKTDFYDRSMDVVSKPGLTAYDAFLAKANALKTIGDTGVAPEKVAEVIYKAATDGTWKMRYQINSALLLWARKLLPDAAFFGIVRKATLGS
jgi:NADP-dependent 3-hydroxy acid dehydrogenase YdfG